MATSLCYQTWQYFGGQDSSQPVFEELRSLSLVARCPRAAKSRVLSRLSAALRISSAFCHTLQAMWRSSSRHSPETIRKLIIVVVPSASPTGLRIEMYSPACWFGERAGVTGGHVPSDTERHWHHRQHSKRRIQHCSLFPLCAHRHGVWPSWAVALCENVISYRLLRSSCGQRKTIAQRVIFRAGSVYT